MPIPKGYSPQAVNKNGSARLVFQLTQEIPGAGIEGIDETIAEITNQQVVAELAEIAGSESQTPGRVECALRSEATEEMPIGVEDIDEPIA